MARTFAQVQVSIWDQIDFRNLTGLAQRLYFVLMTRVETSLAGVIEWHPGRLSELAADTDPASIEQVAAELEQTRFLVIDRNTQECLLRTMVRHDKTLQRGPKIAAGVVAAWRQVYSKHLRSVIADEAAKDQVSDSVRQVIQPLLDWRIECPTEYVNETPNDTQSDTQFGEVSGQPTTSNQQPTTTRVDALFAGFWSVYPRRVAKKAAEKAWVKAVRSADANTIIAAAARYADQTKNSDPRFIKHPATWLNGGCWDDDELATSTDHPKYFDAEPPNYDNPDAVKVTREQLQQMMVASS